MNALMGQIVLNKHVLRNTLRFYSSSQVSLSSSKQVSEAGTVLCCSLLARPNVGASRQVDVGICGVPPSLIWACKGPKSLLRPQSITLAAISLANMRPSLNVLPLSPSSAFAHSMIVLLPLGAQHDRAAAARRFSARQTHATRSFALILYSIACMRILAHNMSWFTANGPTDGFLASNASIAVWIAVSSSSERKAFVIFWLPAAPRRPRVLVLDRLHEDFSAQHVRQFVQVVRGPIGR